MIFLVRHGEAAAGWGDHPDPGLSDLGQAQAHQVASNLADLGATSLISSPMQRCRETASPLAEHLGTSARIEPAVSENCNAGSRGRPRKLASRLDGGAVAG